MSKQFDKIINNFLTESGVEDAIKNNPQLKTAIQQIDKSNPQVAKVNGALGEIQANIANETDPSKQNDPVALVQQLASTDEAHKDISHINDILHHQGVTEHLAKLGLQPLVNPEQNTNATKAKTGEQPAKNPSASDTNQAATYNKAIQ
jgi:hypothetical protein